MKTTLLLLVVTLLSLPVFAQKDDTSKTKAMNALIEIQKHSTEYKMWSITDSTTYLLRKFHVKHYKSESALLDFWIGLWHIKPFHIVKETTTIEWIMGGVLYRVVCEVKNRKRHLDKSSVKLYCQGKQEKDWWRYCCDDIEKVSRKIVMDEEAMKKESSDPDDIDF